MKKAQIFKISRKNKVKGYHVGEGIKGREKRRTQIGGYPTPLPVMGFKTLKNENVIKTGGRITILADVFTFFSRVGEQMGVLFQRYFSVRFPLKTFR